VVDAVSVLFKVAMGIARRGGQILLFGQNYQATTQITQNDITRNEFVILGSFIAKFTFLSTIKIIESRVLNLEKLITHRLPLSEIHRGIEVIRNQRAIKVVIAP
jgi:(R,R)-butanediol dehydrogenase/meso-butanediol dehydrogenase/diacetyl reductase